MQKRLKLLKDWAITIALILVMIIVLILCFG